MAKQVGIIKLEGKIGDLSFYKSGDDYRVRTSGGVDGERMKTDPNFKRTRENMSEFGSASSTAKKLYRQVKHFLAYFKDRTVFQRLTGLMTRIQKADPESARGERAFIVENGGMLRGFEFNKGVQLNSIINKDLVPSYQVAEEKATLVIPAFNPRTTITSVAGATHVQFLFAAAVLDVESDFPANAEVMRSDYIPLIGKYAGETLEVPLVITRNNLGYMLVGIALFKEENGYRFPLQKGKYNALTIAAVSS